MALVTAKVEFSQDDLSDTTPAWTDITSYVRDVRWWSGKASDLDPPQAGGAQIVLNNSDRRFEPDYSAGAYSPNIKPMRRFRLTMTADGTAHTQGIYYASSWGVGYPARTNYSETTVTCVDGFGILSLDTLPTLTPPGAASYIDVVLADNPIAFFPLNEVQSGPMSALVGAEGQYKGGFVEHVPTSPVTGDAGYAASFPKNAGSYGRSKMDDVAVFAEAGQFTVECVATLSVATNQPLAAGPQSSAPNLQFELLNGEATIRVGGSILTTSPTSFVSGTHHHCATWDGSTLTYYRDGTVIGTVSTTSGAINAADSNEFLYVGNEPGSSSGTTNTSVCAAFYVYALTAAQVAAHANAAINLGYATQTTGNRIASVATNALWSTAGITGGQILDVAARFQNGQARLDEIVSVAIAEQPFGLFYFDDSGNPAYQGMDATISSAATFSDSASDVPYEAITLAYDDDLYNSVTIARDGGAAQTHTDTSSESAYMTRGYNQTGLILATDADADLVAAAICDNFATPRIRVTTLTLNSGTQTARNQMLTREIGDTIRVKRRTDTGEAIDVITRILGKTKHIGPDGNLTCTWNLARGIDASIAVWDLGVTGYSELNSTTILA